jgi:HEPN domain-containing protein
MNEKRVKEWILKAESDLKIGKDELLTENPATDAITFHMQQYVEKYLKAFLIFHGKEIRKTHDITELINDCSKIDSDFEKLYEKNADRLTEYAIEMRYPGDILFPTIEETDKSVRIAEIVKDFILKKLKEKGFSGWSQNMW